MLGNSTVRIGAYVAAITTLTATLLGVAAPVASAAVPVVDPSTYQGVYAGFGSVAARAGGYLSCPPGRKAAAGGATSPRRTGH